MILLLLKRIILFFIILYIPQSLSEFSSLTTPLEPVSQKQSFFDNHDEKLSYSLGVSLGDYINQSFEKQKKIGIPLNKSQLLLGVQDAILNKLKLSNDEIVSNLKELEVKLKYFAKIELEKDAQKNLREGELYMNKFSHMKGVQKTSTGLLYFIKEKGEGIKITNNTKITVHYKGTLVNGTEFDNSYIRKKPVSFFLKDVILGWQEGLKYIMKGGKIKLVIPPHLAYGEKGINLIPGNSTIIFDIELLDVIEEV
ncbi:FKBP-type peptidyl-prolyl cis-trans isomerase [Buchnera aphidicola]|uniref:FKBP-type peptidyl-prolyl cis-trans isomerase n=1 Tax=Buchnera aphidicola TaxID=9 RepID=UPI003BEF03A9